jgi:hypothetical protein
MTDVNIKAGGQYTKEELKDWCYCNVGVNKWLHYSYPGTYKFLFNDDEDAVAFKLRFGV